MEILICILLVSVLTDVLYTRIPNVLIVVGMIAGLAVTYLSSSYQGLITVLGQVVIVMALGMLLYMTRTIGAGDIKMFMMLGCFFPNGDYLDCIWRIAVCAGVIVVGKVILVPECRARFVYLGRYVRKVALTGAVDSYEVGMRENHKEGIRLAIPTCMGVIIYYLEKRYMGI